MRVYSSKGDLSKRLELLGGHLESVDKHPVQRAEPSHRTTQLTRRLSDDAVDRLVTACESGVSSNQLVTDFSIAKGTVLKLLRSRNVTIRNQGLDAGAVDDAVRRYEAGQSLATIAAALDVSPMTVRKALLGRGVVMRDPHGRQP